MERSEAQGVSGTEMGASALPLVSVIVPHYSDLGRLDVCLTALTAQTWPAARFEIIVADNASPQGEAAVAAVIAGRARLVIVKAPGAGPARNGGVGAARGALLAFTDCDCRPAPQWLSEGVRALDQGDIVGGGMTVLVDDPDAPTPVEAFELVFAFDNARYVNQEGFSVSANLFCSRALFERVGGFRVGVPEDMEWCHRARDAGYSLVYAPEAVVGHPARKTWPELVKKWRRLSAERWTIDTARPGGKLVWATRALMLPLSAIAHTPRILTSSSLHGVRARVGAILVLFRLRVWRFSHALGLLAGGEAA